MWWRRLAALGIGLVLTLVVFEFWGRFGLAMSNVLAIEAAAPKAEPVPSPGFIGAYAVEPEKKACPKDQACK